MQRSPAAGRRPLAGPSSMGSPGIPGGFASSRLDHGCKIPSGEAALAADLTTAAQKWPKNRRNMSNLNPLS